MLRHIIQRLPGEHPWGHILILDALISHNSGRQPPAEVHIPQTNALGFAFYGAAAWAYHTAGTEAAREEHDRLAQEELERILTSLRRAAPALSLNEAHQFPDSGVLHTAQHFPQLCHSAPSYFARTMHSKTSPSTVAVTVVVPLPTHSTRPVSLILEEAKVLLAEARKAAQEETDPVRQAAARAVSTACGTLTTPTNALGFAFYGVGDLGVRAGPDDFAVIVRTGLLELQPHLHRGTAGHKGEIRFVEVQVQRTHVGYTGDREDAHGGVLPRGSRHRGAPAC